MNKLIEELSTAALAEFDAETRFRARAAIGSPEKALRILDKPRSLRETRRPS
jgi:hypothetical protein